MLASRASSRSASRRASSGRPASSIRRRSSATWVSPPSVLPELALDRAELLAQVELALLLGQPLLGVGGDLAAQLAHGQLALQQIDQPAQLGR